MPPLIRAYQPAGTEPVVALSLRDRHGRDRGDPGHAAARHVHAAAGFTPMPVARYFKALCGTGGREERQ